MQPTGMMADKEETRGRLFSLMNLHLRLGRLGGFR
jgi:hypothetical protein